MTHTYHHIIALFALGLLSACSSNKEEHPEVKGMEMLQQARTLLSNGLTDAARDTIMSLRKRYPTAFDARRQAILTLDSIELKAAQEAHDTLKTEFFLRKIDFDKNNTK